jgi:hypothetical protein
MTLMERVSPTGVSRSVFASVMRLSGGIGLFAGFYLCYSRSISALYRFSSSYTRFLDPKELGSTAQNIH